MRSWKQIHEGFVRAERSLAKGKSMKRIMPALAALALLILPGGPTHAAVLQLAGPGDFSAGATVIDFDDATQPTAANTLYLSLGVEFQNTGAPVPIQDWTALGRTTTSPTNVIATVDDLDGTGSEFSSYLDLFFTDPTTEIGAYFGNDQGIQPTMQMLLSVYTNANDALPSGFVTVAVNANTSVDQFVGLRSDIPFARARFENILAQGDLSVVLDDVIFYPSAAPVPEPSSLALMSLGAAPLLARLRRRSRAEGAGRLQSK
jgi:hypothetical protein